MSFSRLQIHYMKHSIWLLDCVVDYCMLMSIIVLCVAPVHQSRDEDVTVKHVSVKNDTIIKVDAKNHTEHDPVKLKHPFKFLCAPCGQEFHNGAKQVNDK